MKAVLLAAGEGTRLRPLTFTTPKCMVTINGKPLLDYWLEKLILCDEIDEIFINVCYLKDLVVNHIQENWLHCKKIKIWYEEKLLGTAGTLRTNYEPIKGQDVMVVHADNLSFFDLDTFINSYQKRRKDIQGTLMLFETDTPSQCGIVEVDEEGTLLRMHEKIVHPPGNLANAAVYIFGPSIIHWISQQEVNDISHEVIQHYLGHLNTWTNLTYHRDIGSPESYRQAQQDISGFLLKQR
jgi:mannose-1-phosphate guanylyltransferase